MIGRVALLLSFYISLVKKYNFKCFKKKLGKGNKIKLRESVLNYTSR